MFKFKLFQFLRIILIIQLANHVWAFPMDTDIIKYYFNYKTATFINVYHCLNKKAEIEFVKNLSTEFTFRLFNMNNELVILRKDIFLKYNQKLGVIIDGVNCPIEDTLNQFSNFHAFIEMHPMLIFMENSSQIQQTFENKIMSISTDLKVITEDNSLYDIYNPSTLHGAKLVYNLYPYWNTQKRIFEGRPKENLYWIRKNMTGIVFKARANLPKDFEGTLEEYLHSDENRDINAHNRFHAVLMYHTRDFYNYSLILSRTNSWGFLQPNGTFDGLVGAIERREIDFGFSPLFVKGERLRVLDYGRRTWKLRSAFVFRIPKRPASYKVFLRPLDGPVWYLTALAGIIIVILLKISLRASEIVANTQIVDTTFESSWSHITLFTIGAMCQQGSATSPDGMSSRIAFIFIFIFTVLLFQYYSASIVSILIMMPAKFILNLKDLSASSLILGCEDILYTRDYIYKMSNDSIVKSLLVKSPTGTLDSFYVEPEVGLARVAAGGYAYHVELATAYPIMSKTFDEDTICSLDEMQLFHVQQMNQPLVKGSPFREMLDHVLHKIDESGLMHRQLIHWYVKKPGCIRTRPETSAVSIEEFYPALSLLLLGMFMSIFILLVEKIIYMYQVKKRDEIIIKQLTIDKKRGLITRVRK